eukprot:TRINITY_DN16986_c0_g1_i1.p1 TRINITY_DN16986_c0_g1~~TRINITY_DN16986_c0_g1_i1.p1  ORF type:complete len:724 (-),score=46.36 TRINITY_DN16986_c0_g1_i1:71-1933(-)
MPVLYKRPIARARVIFFGYFAGAFFYQWPARNSSSTEAHYALVVCSCFICVDDSWGISLAGYDPTNSFSRSAYIANAEKMVEHYQTTSSAEAVRAFEKDHDLKRSVMSLTEAAQQNQWKNVWAQLAYLVGNSFVVFWEAMILAISGESSVYGAELLPSALCSSSDQGSMRELCEKSDTRSKIINTLGSGKAVLVYLACITMWACLKATHDVLLLRKVPESVTLVLGILTLPIHATAVGASLMAAISASEVFVAQLDASQKEGGVPCSCYYKMNDLQALLMITTPMLLLCTYEARQKAVIQAILCGDFLYYKSFDVPFHIVNRHKGWEKLSLMFPKIQAHELAPPSREIQSRQVRSVIKYGGVILRCRLLWDSFLVFAPSLLASSIIFPRGMSLLVTKASNYAWQEPSRWLVIRILLLAPSFTIFSWTMHWIWMNWAIYCRNGRRNWLLITNYVMLPLLNLVLVLPPLEILTTREPAVTPDILYVNNTFWMVGGFMASMKTFWMALEVQLGMGSIAAMQVLTIFTDLAFLEDSGRFFFFELPFSPLRDPCSLVELSSGRDDIIDAYELSPLVAFAKEFVQNEAESGNVTPIRSREFKRRWATSLQEFMQGQLMYVELLEQN